MAFAMPVLRTPSVGSRTSLTARGAPARRLAAPTGAAMPPSRGAFKIGSQFGAFAPGATGGRRAVGICTHGALARDDSPVIDAPDTQVMPAKKSETYNWFAHWYPAAVIECLDPAKPHAMTLCGKDIVIWNDGPTDKKGKKTMGAWRVFEDACPHRAAPLSEGRIEDDGQLLCAYHAWTFDGEGSCTFIPQATAEQQAKACGNPRASCRAMPVKEIDGLLWVWPEAGPAAALESSLHEPVIPADLNDTEARESGKVKKLYWGTKDLQYGWDYFMENVLDPAHVVVSHHNIIGNRYTDAKPYKLKVIEPVTKEGGFKVENPSSDDQVSTAFVSFRPPHLVEICSHLSDGSKLTLCLYATPTTPGNCRQIGCQVMTANEEGKFNEGISKMFNLKLPHWLTHLLGNLFLHQDLAFLHHQEKILAQRGYEAKAGGSEGDYLDHIYTPTEQDKAVIMFRRWLKLLAGGGLPWPKGRSELPPRATHEAVHDVYDSHVRDCHKCRKALDNFRTLRIASIAAAAVCILLRVEMGLWASAISATVLSLVAGGIHKVIGLFHRYEFTHQANK